ncbi:MAG: radical SAM protein [Clostridia bacterium]|nr:radical SAM protein [Clostridia bacterium]
MSGTRQHANIPIFIPHLGCPHTCVFCNQRTISGHGDFDLSRVRDEIETALATLGDCRHREIAFFGGSFTGIDRGLMISLLELAQEYVRAGDVHAIRLSTRPDYVDGEILEILSHYAVETVELGLQSMDDRVLTASARGHDGKTAERACESVKAHGFRLVGQMMIGLPAADGASERMTAERIVSLGADAARVYPTVVFRNTALCRMAERGVYRVLPQSEMLERTADVLEIFARASLPVIRVGLCASENLSDPDTVWGGANESAVGELAMSEVFYRRIREAMLRVSLPNDGVIRLFVPRGAASRAVGHRRANATRLCREFSLRRIRVLETDRLQGYQIEIMCDN